jgi:hypothetical protein
MSVQRSQSWQVSADTATLDQAIDDFARRQGLRVSRSDGGFEVSRGSQSGMRGRGARLADEQDLPINGSIIPSEGRVEATFESDGVGLILGHGPMTGGVEDRFESILSGLLDDLGSSLPTG